MNTILKLDRFKPGIDLRKQLTAARMNRILDALESLQLGSGKGYRVTRTPSGTVLGIDGLGTGVSARPGLPLQITRKAPAGWDPIANPLADNDFFISWGLVNGVEVSNIGSKFTVSATTYFFLKITIDEDDPDTVTAVEILTGATINAHSTPAPSAGELPAYVIYRLGLVNVAVIAEVPVYQVFNQGGGSLRVVDYVASASCNASGGMILNRKVDMRREPAYYELS